jgi:hypothetical protein
MGNGGYVTSTKLEDQSKSCKSRCTTLLRTIMPFNIEAFKENLSKYGYLDNNNFEVIVATPKILLNTSIGSSATPSDANRIANNLRFRIDQIRSPAISIQSAEVFRYGIGPMMKQPVNASNQELFFSILVDDRGEIWQYWYNWLRKIFEFNGTMTNSSTTLPSYTAEYKDNYSTILQILIFDHIGAVAQTISVFEAFPTSIREVPFHWGDSNLIKLNISMAFTEFMIEGSNFITGS